MGLDLYHAIPSAKTSNTVDYFTLAEFADKPDFLEKHSHLVTEIDETEWDFHILVFPDNLTKDLIIKRSPADIDRPMLVGDIGELNFKLKEIAARNSLQSKEPVIAKTIDNLLTKENAREIYYHTASYETSFKKVKVLYWDTKGYQRKGMKPQFYEDFGNCKLYFDKPSVLKASSYLKPSLGKGENELKMHFKTNFTDNFIEGESIFFASW